jgi:hypothetical protein
VPFETRIGLHWRPVGIYCWCKDAKMMEILVENLLPVRTQRSRH